MPDNSSGIVVVPIVSMNSLAWSNMPAALTELAGVVRYRQKLNLLSFRSINVAARLVANMVVNATASAKFRIQYSLDASNWLYLDGGDGTVGQLTGLNSQGLKVGSWVNLHNAAKQDIFLRVVGLDGDGVADPAFSNMSIEFAMGTG